MKRRNLYLLGVAVLVVGVLLWLRLAPDTKANGQPQAARRGPTGPVQAAGYLVGTQPLTDRVSTTGTVLPNEEVAVTSETNGRVVRIGFQEGARVQRGQLLVQLNDDELQAQLARAQQRQKLLEAQEYRSRVLLQKQAVSQQEYDVVASDLASAKADVQLIEAQVAQTRIRAPFDGTIGLRQISVGSYLTPGTRVATLQNLDQVKLEFSVPEKYADRVRAGQPVRFTVRNTDKDFEGKIYAVEPRIETDTRTLLIRARASNPRGELVPGAFADVVIALGQKPNAILVPTVAVIPEQGGQFVYKLVQGKAQRQPVAVGVRMPDRIEITDGLAVGDTILTSAIQFLRPGAAVQVQMAQADSSRS